MAAFNLDRANRERDFQAASLGFVPDVGADGVTDVVERGLVFDPRLDFVGDGRVREIGEENLGWREGENTSCSGCCGYQCFSDRVGWGLVVEPDPDSDSVLAIGMGEVRDGGTDNSFVGNIQVNVVRGS